MTEARSERGLIPALALLAIAAVLACVSVVVFGGWERVQADLPAFLSWLLLGAAAFYTSLVVATIAVRVLLRLGSPK